MTFEVGPQNFINIYSWVKLQDEDTLIIFCAICLETAYSPKNYFRNFN